MGIMDLYVAQIQFAFVMSSFVVAICHSFLQVVLPASLLGKAVKWQWRTRTERLWPSRRTRVRATKKSRSCPLTPLPPRPRTRTERTPRHWQDKLCQFSVGLLLMIYKFDIFNKSLIRKSSEAFFISLTVPQVMPDMELEHWIQLKWLLYKINVVISISKWFNKRTPISLNLRHVLSSSIIYPGS